MKAIYVGLALLLLSLLAACEIDRSADRQLRSGPEVTSVENFALSSSLPAATAPSS
jgi:hypothetical protein